MSPPRPDHPYSSRPTDADRGEVGRDVTASTHRPLRVSLVNDYEVIVQGLDAMLSRYPDRIVLVEHVIGGTPEENVDIALFDTFAGRRDAISRAADMVESGHARHVVLYTWDASSEFLEAVREIGAAAVVLKSVGGEELVATLERVAAGERPGLDHVTRSPGSDPADPLSNREREVLAMLALGCSNSQIANELFLSIDTVKTYVRRVFHKLGVHNRTQAAMLAGRYGVAPPPSRLERVRSGHGVSEETSGER